MSDEKKLSDRLRSYLYSMHPIMLSVGELFSYADEIADLEQRLAEAERLHSELLFCVAQKIPGETCHETALRYIKERESRDVPGSPQENTHD